MKRILKALLERLNKLKSRKILYGNRAGMIIEDFKTLQNDIEIVLTLIQEQQEENKKKDKYIDFYKKGLEREIESNRENIMEIIKQDKEIENKDKMIDLMAEELQKHIFVLHDGDTVTSKKGIIEHYKRKATNDG